MDLLEVPVASASFEGGKPSRPLLLSARAPPPRDPASLTAGLCFPCILYFDQEASTTPRPPRGSRRRRLASAPPPPPSVAISGECRPR